MARSIDRIDGYLSRLGAIWKSVPDWRFGQLMCNLLGSAGVDPFFPEDDVLFDAMEKSFFGTRPGEIVNNHIEEVLRDEQQT